MKQELHDEVIKRATIKGEVRCEWCKRKTKAPQVHHIYGRKVETAEVLICLCSEYKNKCHDHQTGRGQMILNEIKVSNSAMLIEKYGEEEARKRAGGKLFYTSVSKLERFSDIEVIHERNYQD